MDAFYASIEIRDNPRLQSRPVIVGTPGRRSVVTTCNYIAREFGVHSAQPMVRALKLCPNAVCIPPRIAYYRSVSRQIMDVFDAYSECIEPLSLDEAFLDMTDTAALVGPPVEAAQALKDAVREATELTCSVGIGPNKFLAKFASDLNKPDGLTVVPRGAEAEFIASYPIRRLWGVGPRTAEKIETLELETIGDIAQADPAWLRRNLGRRLADHVHTLSRGIDRRRVVSDRVRKSVGSETTLREDISGRSAIEPILSEQCLSVSKALQKRSFRARGIRVKVRYSSDFQIATRQGPLPGATDRFETLFESAKELLDGLELDRPIRLVGATAFDLLTPDDPEQLTLFDVARRKLARRVD